MRLIDGDVLIRYLRVMHGNGLVPQESLKDAVKTLSMDPEAEPKRGRWIAETNDISHCHCSVCGVVWGWTANAMRYCPQCGAKMDGGEDDG